MKKFNVSRLLLACMWLCAGSLTFASVASADSLSLEQLIIAYNLERQRETLADETYRGEEGILRIRPEIAQALGLRAVMDQDYLESKSLYEKADRLFGQVLEALNREETPVESLAELSLGYNEILRSAYSRLMDYRATLTKEIDDRLNEELCRPLMRRLLQESLDRNSRNLRDSLAFFYNRCQGIDGGEAPLNPDNVRFVNHVFSRFAGEAAEETLAGFDLDRLRRNEGEISNLSWKPVLEKAGSAYASLVESIVAEYQGADYRVDPLLFMALVKKESSFNPRAVSAVGAVGLTQIMPKTGDYLGMKNIFAPGYLEEAKTLLAQEANLKRRAIALIAQINEKNKLELAGSAKNLMQRAIRCGIEGRNLYSRYRKDLLERGADDRLDPRQSLRYGFKYFASMVKLHDGDISLALASYNAGPGGVRKYGGIPPYLETVNFRNRILGYYREYVSSAGNAMVEHP